VESARAHHAPCPAILPVACHCPPQELAQLRSELQREREGHAAARADAQAAAAQAAAAARERTPPRTPAGGGLPLSPGSPLSAGGTPVVVSGDLPRAIAALPEDLGSMTVSELRQWVVYYRLEDERYMALAGNARTKKADWWDMGASGECRPRGGRVRDGRAHVAGPLATAGAP
jgi:hypothetical protein